ncbi:MAG: hypothetical protein II504_03145, partial [Clostridia bacterium]|nr:hypothetical protein [Clostridia bacterium]
EDNRQKKTAGDEAARRSLPISEEGRNAAGAGGAYHQRAFHRFPNEKKCSPRLKKRQVFRECPMRKEDIPVLSVPGRPAIPDNECLHVDTAESCKSKKSLL